MRRRTLGLLSIVGLLGALLLAGCPRPDPNADTQEDEDTATMDTDTPEPDTDPGDTEPMDAPDDTSDAGQCPRKNQQSPHAGGQPSTSPPTDDAGLQNVLDRIDTIISNNGGSWPTQDGSEDAKNVQLTGDDQIEITGAIVTSTSYRTENFDNGQKVFWLQDSKAAIQTFLDSPLQCPPNPYVRVGDRVSFTVTALKVFDGTPEITAVANFGRDDSASSRTVPYSKKTGEDIVLDDYAEIVKVGGELTSQQGACGCPYFCYEMTHGGKTVTFRVRGDIPQNQSCDDENVTINAPYPTGTCITYVGPVGSFPGPLSSRDETIQLNATNFDWFFRHQNAADGGMTGGDCQPKEFFTGQIFTPEMRSN